MTSPINADETILNGERVAFAIKTNHGAKWLIPFVVATREAGARVLVLLPPGPGNLEQQLHALDIHTARHEALGSNPLKALIGIPSFARLLKSFRPTVLNYYLYRSAIVCRLASLKLGAVRVHSVVGPLFYESAIVALVERLLGQLDDVVFAGSGAVAALAASNGLKPDRIEVVRCGADLSDFSPPDRSSRYRCRSKFGIKNDEPLFVMVSYWYGPKRLGLGGRDIKGHDTLLEAWISFKRNGGQGHLLLVGGGFGSRGEAYRAEMSDRFSLDCESSVTAIGTVDDVRDAYRAADVSVSPSRSENYGATIEASGMGVPSIASTVGGLPEVVKEGETGWLFSPGDAAGLEAQLSNAAAAVHSGDAKRLGLAARAQVIADFDWSTITASYVSKLATLQKSKVA